MRFANLPLLEFRHDKRSLWMVRLPPFRIPSTSVKRRAPNAITWGPTR